MATLPSARFPRTARVAASLITINKTIIRKHSIVVAKFFAIGIDDGIQHLADMIEQSFSSSATFPLLPVSPGSDELGGSSTS